MTGNTTYLEESFRSSLEQRACVADRWRKLAAHETGHEIQTLPQVIYKNKSQVARVKQVEGTSTPVSVSDSPITLGTLQQIKKKNALILSFVCPEHIHTLVYHLIKGLLHLSITFLSFHNDYNKVLHKSLMHDVKTAAAEYLDFCFGYDYIRCTVISVSNKLLFLFFQSLGIFLYNTIFINTKKIITVHRSQIS